MKLASMKNDTGHGEGCGCCHAPEGPECDKPDYPWGLRIHLEETQLAALGIQSLPASGAPVALEAVAMVVGMGEEMVDGKPRRRLELQITDLGLAAAGTSKYARMYADDESMRE